MSSSKAHRHSDDSSHDEATAGQSGKKPMRSVLAVDDSSSMREVVMLTLKMAGFDVMQASDGVEGLALAQTKQFDLVLTDINMPNMNGIELIRALRALPGYKSTPILTLTTERELPKRQEGKAAGATGWIVKPFLPDRLIETVQRVLQ
jgi:two-component system chemotaxis response regulator CheY